FSIAACEQSCTSVPAGVSPGRAWERFVSIIPNEVRHMPSILSRLLCLAFLLGGLGVASSGRAAPVAFAAIVSELSREDEGLGVSDTVLIRHQGAMLAMQAKNDEAIFFLFKLESDSTPPIVLAADPALVTVHGPARGAVERRDVGFP